MLLSTSLPSAFAPRPRHIGLSLLLFLLSLTSAVSVAAQAGQIQLQVTDPGGKNVAGAKITVKDAGGTLIAEGETSKKGKLELEIKQEGAYQVTIEKSGLATRTVSVEVSAGMNTAANVGLIDQAMADKQEAVDNFNAGVAAIQAKNAEEALAAFSAAAELDPTLADAHRMVAILSADAGDLKAAGTALDRYLALAPDGLANAAPAAYEVYRARGETDKLPAVREHLKAIGFHSDVAIKVYNEGVAALKASEKEKAIALFTEAATLDPEMTTAYRSLGALYFNDKEYEQAQVYLAKLLAVVPSHTEGHRLQFFSQYELGQTATATATATAWSKIDPLALPTILEHAEKLFKVNQADQAGVLANMVLEADEKNGAAHYAMGRIMAQKGQIADAKKHLQRFLELDPNSADAADARQMLAGL